MRVSKPTFFCYVGLQQMTSNFNGKDGKTAWTEISAYHHLTKWSTSPRPSFERCKWHGFSVQSESTKKIPSDRWIVIAAVHHCPLNWVLPMAHGVEKVKRPLAVFFCIKNYTFSACWNPFSGKCIEVLHWRRARSRVDRDAALRVWNHDRFARLQEWSYDFAVDSKFSCRVLSNLVARPRLCRTGPMVCSRQHYCGG